MSPQPVTPPPRECLGARRPAPAEMNVPMGLPRRALASTAAAMMLAPVLLAAAGCTTRFGASHIPLLTCLHRSPAVMQASWPD